MSTTAPRRRRLGPRAARRRRGRRGRRPPARRGRARARTRSPQRYAGKVAELDGPGARRRDGRARGDLRARRPRRLLRRTCASAPTPPTPPTARCCSASRSAATGDRDAAAVLRPRVGGARPTSAPRSCSPPTGSTTAATTCARPPLPPAPAHRARGEGDDREVGHRPRRVGAPVQRADQRDRGRPRRRGRARARSTSRSAACMSPDREVRRARRRGGHRGAGARRCAPAPTSSTRCCTTRRSTTACAPTRRGSRPATSPTRPATSPSRRWSRRSRDATSSRAAGTGSRPRLLGVDAPRRLRPHGVGRRGDEDDRLGRGPRHRPRRLRRLLRRARRRRRAFFDERWIDAPVRPAKRGGAFCAYTVPSVHPYVLLNYTSQAPRRADAGPRARPRPARRAGPRRAASSSSTRR